MNSDSQEELKLEDIAVIGLGPAGVAACLALAEAGYYIVAYEPGLIGGQVNMTADIHNYPGYSGPTGALNARFTEDIQRLVDAGRMEVVKSSVKALDRDGDTFLVDASRARRTNIRRFRAVVVASGTRYRPYSVPDTSDSVRGRGFSRCAICDGPFYKGRDVMVVGGGESAFQEATYLASICRSVTLINRRTIFRAGVRDVEAFKRLPNTRIIAPAVTVSCSGNGKLEHVVIKDPNDEGESSYQILDVEACFIYIGQDAASQFVNIPEALDSTGCLDVDEDMEVAAVPGLFGAGDVIDTPLRQVATAVGYGSLAGRSAARYLGVGKESIRG